MKFFITKFSACKAVFVESTHLEHNTKPARVQPPLPDLFLLGKQCPCSHKGSKQPFSAPSESLFLLVMTASQALKDLLKLKNPRLFVQTGVFVLGFACA